MKKLTPGDLEEIREMRTSGLTNEQIAENLRVSLGTVNYHIRRMKIRNVWLSRVKRGPKPIGLPKKAEPDALELAIKAIEEEENTDIKLSI